MNEKTKAIIALVLAMSLFFGSVALIKYHDGVLDAHHNEIWRLNWEPSIGNLRINGTTYYIVSVGDDPAFATTNMTEATEWAMNFTKEWG
jgi:hypothetical protein